MSTKYLGPTFDIHGGGLDLVFPHHENELAQSHAAGDGFARYWVHNGLLGLSGEKMSKSLGNSLLVDVMINEVRPADLRYYLGQAHYRSELEYSPEALAEAAAAYRRIEGFVIRAGEASAGGQDGTGLDPGALTAAALPAAFTAAHGRRPRRAPGARGRARGRDRGQQRAGRGRPGRRGQAGGERAGDDGRARARSAGRALGGRRQRGCGPWSTRWSSVALGQRQAARERKDYAAADAIRDELIAAGIAVEDTPGGPRWELRR